MKATALTRNKLIKRLICIALVVLVLILGYAAFFIPDTSDLASVYSNLEMSSIVYDRNEEEIDKLYYTEDRKAVSIGEIPEDTKNAFIAIEDKTFYRHHGINFKRIFGAVFNRITGRSSEVSGTSTITQQLARNVYLSDIKSQRTLRRKFSEVLCALKMETTLSKDEILEAYLNTIYLGYGCYGIEAAAHTYFGKDVNELTLAESAALAALPQAPDSYALIKDEKDDNTVYLKKYKVYANDLSKDRRDLVLDLMAEQGYISAEDAEKAKVDIKKLLDPHFEKKSNEFTYFTDYVESEVAEDLASKYSMTEKEAERLIRTGGLSIYSTADKTVQLAIDREFRDDYNFPYSEEDPQAAMVITEVGSGNIIAMAGGRDANGQKLFNRATAPRQPGSAIKPLSVYAAALQDSYEYAESGEPFPFKAYGFDWQGATRWGNYITAGSTVIDEVMYARGEPWPQNFSRSYSGYNTFRTALQRSINTCAVKIQLQIGPEYSIETLKKFGITTLADDGSVKKNDLNPAAMALGAMVYGTTPLEMALAYAVFPNGGVRYTAASYTKVTDRNGKTILENEPEYRVVINEGVAFIMTDCLESVVSRGIAGNAAISGVQAGGKTGTTNDDCDYWFVGFTPKYSAALWVGTDHNKAMGSSSSATALLWSRIMSQIPDITEGEYPPQPENVVYKYGEYYTEGTEP